MNQFIAGGWGVGIKPGDFLCLLEIKLHPLVLILCGNDPIDSLFLVFLQKDAWGMHFSLLLSSLTI